MTGDERLPDWVRKVVPEGLVDLHTHFLPERVLRKVWAFFDDADRHTAEPGPSGTGCPRTSGSPSCVDSA
jgi:hypothetical protein